MIALLDYGAGNLTSVRKALAALGAEVTTPASPHDLLPARGIIVPGVGHFDATRALDAKWRAAICDSLDRGGFLFGICLGMQWLFEGSDEAPDLPGLGILDGRCLRLPADRSEQPGRPASSGRKLKIPHVGWNSLDQPRRSELLRDIVPGAQVYFTHSYVAPVVPASAAITTYGIAFSAAVESGRAAGVQFHPEKSGDVGLRILQNWLEQLS